MKYLVISDIHANLEALEATLAAAGDYDRVLVLGDLVGYGADPNAVVERVRALPSAAIIRGNHDKVGGRARRRRRVQPPGAARDRVDRGGADAGEPRVAGGAAAGPGRRRRPRRDLPRRAVRRGRLHLRRPRRDARAARGARAALPLRPHARAGRLPPRAASELQHAIWPAARRARSRSRSTATRKYLVNCGAVGQPRDGDPRAAFGILDTDAHGAHDHARAPTTWQPRRRRSSPPACRRCWRSDSAIGR